jgi:hypothetical protein
MHLRHGVCTPESCACALLQVVDTDTGKFKFDDVRTSSGYFLKRGQDDVIKRLEHRIAEWTRVPVENGEPFHILRYQVQPAPQCTAAADGTRVHRNRDSARADSLLTSGRVDFHPF